MVLRVGLNSGLDNLKKRRFNCSIPSVIVLPLSQADFLL